MKKYFIVALASVAALTLASCVKESSSNMNEEKTPIDSQELITINARIPEGGFTKVDMNEAAYGGAINLVWHAGDKIIVTDADDETNTQEFTLTGGAGTTEGTFTGKAVTADSYIIVYDSIGDEFEFSEQTQAADASTDHLKYKAVLTGVDDYTDFEFSDMGAAAAGGAFNSSSVLRVRAKLGDLDPADVNAVILKADEAIFAGSYELKVNIATPGEEGEMDFITVYATMPDEDIVIPDGTGLVAQFQMSDKSYDKYTVYRELGVGVIESGKVNSFNIDCGSNFTKFANKSDENIGTAANPYLVGDQHQMAAMATEMEAGSTVYFTLVDDVDLTGVTWIPLNYTDPYDKAIYFDGDGHVISNFTATAAYGYPSFAGVVYGTIKNVVFDTCNITGGSNNTAVVGGYIGTGEKDGICENIIVKDATINAAAEKNTRNAGIIGGVLGTEDSKVINCHVIGTNSITQSTTTYTGCNVGGLIGNVNAAGTITGCTVKANLNNAGSYYTGGVIGQIGGAFAAKISDCAYLGGTLTAGRANDNSPVAGFIGYVPNAGASFKNCYVTDAVINAPACGRSGGFVGQVGNTNSFESCYVENSSVSAGLNNGGFAGVFYNSTLTKSYVKSTTVTANKAQVSAFIAYPQNATISYCYVASDVLLNAGAYTSAGGFFGMAKNGNNVTECYEAANITGTAASLGAFIGTLDQLPTALTKCIAWDGSLNFYGYSGQAPADIETVVHDNYCGTEGTISSQADALGWDENVWDLTGSVPVLK